LPKQTCEMKNFDFKKILPHLIAIAIFLITTAIFCKPAFNADAQASQSDMDHVFSVRKQLDETAARNGYFPLWMPNMFAGMPAYNIAVGGERNALDKITVLEYIDHGFRLFLKEPFSFFFLSCICFYIMALCFGVKTQYSIIGALAFAFCTYNPLIISVGHITKMYAMAYAPALIGAVYYLINKKTWFGFVLATLFAALEIRQAHPQISYYALIAIIIMVAAHVINALKNGTIVKLLKPIGLLAVAGFIGVCCSASITLVIRDYGKDSKRGGQLIMDSAAAKPGTKIVNGRTTGLDVGYAFQWSEGIGESFTLVAPGAAGYGAQVRAGENEIFPNLDESSNTYAYLTENAGIDGNQAAEFTQGLGGRMYWGAQPFTQGPFYIGAITVALFIIGLFFMQRIHAIWLTIAIIVGLVLSWGKNLPGINYFLFEYLPLYNKLRAPAMALVIVQMLAPLGAALGLQAAFTTEKITLTKIKNAGIALAVFFIVIAIYCFGIADYTNENKQLTNAIKKIDPSKLTQTSYDSLATIYPAGADNMLRDNLTNAFKGDDTKVNGLLRAIKEDRAKLFKNDLLFIFLYFALAFVLFFIAYKTNSKNIGLALVALATVIQFVDLYQIDKKYFNENNFESKEGYTDTKFKMQPYDTEILKDKDPNFRVFNLASGDPFQETSTSYLHKSLGGYSPMKIGIYDDLYTYQLSPNNINPAVLNMLNCKYVIQKTAQQNAPGVALRNPDALGNAWLVKHVSYVSGSVAEMKALNKLNTKDSAVAQQEYQTTIGAIGAPDTTEFIKQTSFDNDKITYESTTKGTRLAVFSEIFYKDWYAYIDGKKTDVAKVNYALRGLAIPAGNHKIEFKIEPPILKTSLFLDRLGNISLLVLLVAFIANLFIGKKQQQQAA
jgi:hypothetical protein